MQYSTHAKASSRLPVPTTGRRQYCATRSRKTRTIQTDVRLSTRRSAVVDKLVGAKPVGLVAEPSELDTLWTLRDGADTVLPVVIGDEVTYQKG